MTPRWDRFCELYAHVALMAALILLLKGFHTPAAIFAATGYLLLRSTE